jgi:hypothetical protein
MERCLPGEGVSGEGRERGDARELLTQGDEGGRGMRPDRAKENGEWRGQPFEGRRVNWVGDERSKENQGVEGSGGRRGEVDPGDFCPYGKRERDKGCVLSGVRRSTV